MFPRVKICKKDNKTYKYLVISKSTRKKGEGSTTDDIYNLGNINNFQNSDIESIINGFIKIFSLTSHNSTDNIKILNSYEYGSILLWQRLYKIIGIDKAISKKFNKKNNIKLDVSKYVEMMVVNKCAYPLSKLGLTRWIPTTCYSVMKDYKELNLSPNYFYRSMDKLLSIKDEIEETIYNNLRNLFSINVKLTFYDITSTYFHTDSCDLFQKGYSRDNRPDKPQIIIGIVTSFEGYPIKHFIFKGNTKDDTTVKSTVESLKKEFNIEETIFVGDRGMITKLNLESIINEGYNYIMGVKFRQDEKSEMVFSEIEKNDNTFLEDNKLKIKEIKFKIKNFVIFKIQKILIENNCEINEKKLKDISELLLFKSVEITKEEKLKLKEEFKKILPSLSSKIFQKIFNLICKYYNEFNKEMRYIYCLNSEIKELSSKIREKNISDIAQQLDNLFEKNKDIVKTEKEISEIFSGFKKKYKKFFIFDRDDSNKQATGYKLNNKEQNKASKEDGVFLLCSNNLDLSPIEIVKSYKNLKEVEKINYELKHFVDLRPVLHSLEIRVKAHVFICIISVLLKRIFEIEYLKSPKSLEILEEVSKLKLVKYEVKYSKTDDRTNILYQTTKLTENQQKVFKAVGIKNSVNMENIM